SSVSLSVFNNTPTTKIYTLSLHDALPICDERDGRDEQQDRNDVLARISEIVGDRASDAGPEIVKQRHVIVGAFAGRALKEEHNQDRKSTRLNSSHVEISYAVFCLKKKNS